MTKSTKKERGGVVVTGGARGIGAAICRHLGEKGLAVVSVDVADVEEGTQPAYRQVRGDAGDPKVIAKASALATEAGGSLIGFVANAGITRVAPATTLAMSDWDSVIRVNLSAVFEGARTAKEYLASGGSVVVVSSLAGLLGLPHRAAYSAAKAGLLGLVRSLAVEWGPQNVRVNAVAPGLIDTPLSRRSRESGALPSEEVAAATVPLRRLGQPDDVAKVVAFLLSPDSGYLTGITLPIDGGLGAAFPNP